jgi:hypothetical protein
VEEGSVAVLGTTAGLHPVALDVTVVGVLGKGVADLRAAVVLGAAVVRDPVALDVVVVGGREVVLAGHDDPFVGWHRRCLLR